MSESSELAHALFACFVLWWCFHVCAGVLRCVQQCAGVLHQWSCVIVCSGVSSSVQVCSLVFRPQDAPISPSKTGPTQAVWSSLNSLSKVLYVFFSEYILVIGLKRLFGALSITFSSLVISFPLPFVAFNDFFGSSLFIASHHNN